MTPAAEADTHAKAVVPTVEDYVTGRLTLVMLRNQLDTHVAQLRSQLALAEMQRRETEDVLRETDEKMRADYPEAFERLTGNDPAAP